MSGEVRTQQGFATSVSPPAPWVVEQPTSRTRAVRQRTPSAPQAPPTCQSAQVSGAGDVNVRAGANIAMSAGLSNHAVSSTTGCAAVAAHTATTCFVGCHATPTITAGNLKLPAGPSATSAPSAFTRRAVSASQTRLHHNMRCTPPQPPLVAGTAAMIPTATALHRSLLLQLAVFGAARDVASIGRHAHIHT